MNNTVSFKGIEKAKTITLKNCSAYDARAFNDNLIKLQKSLDEVMELAKKISGQRHICI